MFESNFNVNRSPSASNDSVRSNKIGLLDFIGIEDVKFTNLIIGADSDIVIIMKSENIFPCPSLTVIEILWVPEGNLVSNFHPSLQSQLVSFAQAIT